MKIKKKKTKKIIIYAFLLVFALSFYFFVKMLPDFYFNLGQNAFVNKDYAQAYKNLKLAITFNPKNSEIRYYLVETILSLQPTQDVQKELYEISQLNKPDSADLISDMQISKWRNQIALSSGENYIEQTPSSDKILRWDATKFPLNVYIKNNSTIAPAYYETAIKQAFLQWQGSSHNLIRFNFTNNENDSNIDININSSADMKKCDQADCKYTVAFTVPTINGDLLKKMTISFYDSNNLGKPFAQKEIYNTALHEIGHSLGIMGHSYNKDDIMYMETKQTNYFDAFKSDFQSISPKDINTIRLLYKLIPDITNTPLSKFDSSRQFYAPIVLGSDEQINSRKMLEAQNYITAAPGLPNGYIDLSGAFLELKQYNKAVEALDKALTLCSNNSEKFIVYYNYAVIYMEIKDWNNALKYITMAEQANPSADTEGLTAMIHYNLGDKELAKKSYSEALEKSPDNIIDAHNLATIYIRELNLVQAGKVLNKLIQANPDAKNDPRIKVLSWVTLFFK